MTDAEPKKATSRWVEDMGLRAALTPDVMRVLADLDAKLQGVRGPDGTMVVIYLPGHKLEFHPHRGRLVVTP